MTQPYWILDNIVIIISLLTLVSISFKILTLSPIILNCTYKSILNFFLKIGYYSRFKGPCVKRISSGVCESWDIWEPILASISAPSLPILPLCPGT